MKLSHHSLEYKKQSEPNKKYRELKEKQKALIANWMFEKTCLYYHQSGDLPDEEASETIVQEICQQLEKKVI